MRLHAHILRSPRPRAKRAPDRYLRVYALEWLRPPHGLMRSTILRTTGQMAASQSYREPRWAGRLVRQRRLARPCSQDRVKGVLRKRLGHLSTQNPPLLPVSAGQWFFLLLRVG